MVYGRDYDGRELSFDTSGGLLHSTLVMQDDQTDSYWSILSGEAVTGELTGTPLAELPVGAKMRWREWVSLHPDTEVLSVKGREHDPENPFDDYFASEEGYRGAVAEDGRLPSKEPVFAFRWDGTAYAVPFGNIVGGRTLEIGERRLFLYRPAGAEIFHSSGAWSAEAPGFERRDGVWIHVSSGARFDAEQGGFREVPGGPRPFAGTDTFWINWSATHPETRILP